MNAVQFVAFANMTMQDSISDIIFNGNYKSIFLQYIDKIEDAISSLLKQENLGKNSAELYHIICNSIEDYFGHLNKFISQNFPSSYWQELELLRKNNDCEQYQLQFSAKINEIFFFYTNHAQYIKFICETFGLSMDFMRRFESEFYSSIIRAARSNILANCVYFIKYFPNSDI